MLLERSLLPQIESLLADRTELWVSAGDVSLSGQKGVDWLGMVIGNCESA